MSKKSKNPVSDEQEDKEWGGSSNRVNRGGNSTFPAYYLCPAQHGSADPSSRGSNVGFRIVKNIPKGKER